MQVIVSYKKKKLINTLKNIGKNSTSIAQETPRDLGTLCETPGQIDIYLYIYIRIFKKLTTFWKNMNSQDQYLKQLKQKKTNQGRI